MQNHALQNCDLKSRVIPAVSLNYYELILIPTNLTTFADTSSLWYFWGTICFFFLSLLFFFFFFCNLKRKQKRNKKKRRRNLLFYYVYFIYLFIYFYSLTFFYFMFLIFAFFPVTFLGYYRYPQFWFFRSGSRTDFSTTFFVWFFEKNIFHVILMKQISLSDCLYFLRYWVKWVL